MPKHKIKIQHRQQDSDKATTASSSKNMNLYYFLIRFTQLKITLLNFF